MKSLGSVSNARLWTLGVLIVLLLAWWRTGLWYEQRLIAERRSEVLAEVTVRGNALSSAINRRLARLQGLHAFVLTEYDEPNLARKFELFAAGLYEGSLGVRNLALAPGGTVQYVFPLEGNDSVTGYTPLHDPRVEIRTDVQRAILTRKVILSGPVELVQGGQGLIALQAVFVNGEYWGLVNIVVDMPHIVEEAGLQDDTGEVTYALRDGHGSVLLGTAAIFKQNPVTSRLELPEGVWQLAAVPHGGWDAAVAGSLHVFQIVGLVIVGLVTSLTYLMLNRQADLALAVEQRTQEISTINAALERDIVERKRAEAALRESEEQYRSVFEATSDGLFINDLETGRLVDFNPAAHHMHGYTEEEFRQLQPRDFIHPDSHRLFVEYIDKIRSGQTFKARAVDVKKDGTPFHIEVLGTAFTYRGEPHTLAVVRDITEQVQAYELLEQRVKERTHELSTLLEVTRNIASTLELEPLLDLILVQLQAVVNYSGCAIFSRDDGVLQLRAYRGAVTQEQIAPDLFSMAGAVGSEIVSTHQPCIILDAADGTQQTPPLTSQSASELRSWMGVPLIVRDQLIGLLVFFHVQPGYYSHDGAQLALAFANQVAVAIENASLYRKAKGLAALEERQKLSRELHDSVSQALYGIALGTRTALTMLAQAPPSKNTNGLREPLDYVLSLAEAGLTEMRALILELRPESLEMEGLVVALGKQIAALHARHHIEVRSSFCDEPDVSLEIKETLYRVAQEALHNVVKHAKASRVTASLVNDQGALLLEITDNGRGFDVTGDFPSHLGLRSMKERVAGIRGELTIESSPGVGTRILARVPVDHRETGIPVQPQLG